MNLKGGYIIISLMSMALVIDSDYASITDVIVLKQLLELKDYVINPSKELKPIYLRFKDEDGYEHVEMCTLSRVSGGLLIHFADDYRTLEISIAYDINEETQEVYIDSASYLFDSLVGNIKQNLPSEIVAGTIVDVVGIDADDQLVRGSISVGTKLYLHTIKKGSSSIMEIISPYPSKITEVNYFSVADFLSSVILYDAYHQFTFGPTRINVVSMRILRQLTIGTSNYNLISEVENKFINKQYLYFVSGPNKFYNVAKDTIDLTTGEIKKADTTGLTEIDISSLVLDDTVTELN